MRDVVDVGQGAGDEDVPPSRDGKLRDLSIGIRDVAHGGFSLQLERERGGRERQAEFGGEGKEKKKRSGGVGQTLNGKWVSGGLGRGKMFAFEVWVYLRQLDNRVSFHDAFATRVVK